MSKSTLIPVIGSLKCDVFGLQLHDFKVAKLQTKYPENANLSIIVISGLLLTLTRVCK